MLLDALDWSRMYHRKHPQGRNNGRNISCFIRNSKEEGCWWAMYIFLAHPWANNSSCLLIHADSTCSQLQTGREGGRGEQPIHWICAIWEDRGKQEKQSLPPNFAVPYFQVLSVLWAGKLWPPECTHTCIYACLHVQILKITQLVITGQFRASAEVHPHHHRCVLAVSKHGVESLLGRKWEQTMQPAAACSL